jgi:hypothetical protein
MNDEENFKIYHKPTKAKKLKELKFSTEKNRANSLFKRDFIKNQVETEPDLASQLYKLYNEHHYSLNYLASLFDLSEKQTRNYVAKGKKYALMTSRNIPGAPRKLSFDQENKVVEHIITEDSQNQALTRKNIVDFVYEQFEVHVTKEWVNVLVSRRNELKIVLATPLEEHRATVSTETIKEHQEKLSLFINNIHPSLLINIDETGLGGVKKQGKKKVIVAKSTTKRNHYYRIPTNQSHISFLVGICSDGTLLKTLAIIKGTTIPNELEEFGLTQKYMVVYSQERGYMTNYLFLEYINHIFIPEIERRRSILGDQNARAGVLWDGLLPHTQMEVLELLSRNNVEALVLPPHSSHLTQPLDLLLFGLFKRQYHQYHLSKLVSPLSNRLLKGMSALHSVSTPWNIQASFGRAGIRINFDNNSLCVEKKLNGSLELSFLLNNDNITMDKEREKKRKRTEKQDVPKSKASKIQQLDTPVRTNSQDINNNISLPKVSWLEMELGSSNSILNRYSN